MFKPPFKRSVSPLSAASGCCDSPATSDAVESSAQGRTKLTQLDPHLHCSVIGTCLSTAELRKLMARFTNVQGASDLELHHEAVGLASQGGDAAKALHKALDQRHANTLRSFAAVHDEAALSAAWDEASRQGEIPGAYWAVLTHRQITPALRKRAFGEVHMLSHLVGSANRADIRRLVALERDNAELNDRLEREQQRRQDLVIERNGLGAKLQRQGLDRERQCADLRAARGTAPAAADHAVVALHTERRERAEQSAAGAWAEVERLRRELEHLRQHALQLSQELSAAEHELRQISAEAGEDRQAGVQLLAGQLHQRRILYVGGRPSSTPAIRDLVLRHGGEFLHHDGGLEVRKGLLASAVAKADLVVFPVDCIDHDSALQLKRLAERHGIAFVALRNASVAGFAAALTAHAAPPLHEAEASPSRFCLKHG